MAPEDEKIFVATVPDKVHGAGVLAYQNFMDQAAESMSALTERTERFAFPATPRL